MKRRFQFNMRRIGLTALALFVVGVPQLVRCTLPMQYSDLALYFLL
jgi:hypothetical protein